MTHKEPPAASPRSGPWQSQSRMEHRGTYQEDQVDTLWSSGTSPPDLKLGLVLAQDPGHRRQSGQEAFFVEHLIAYAPEANVDIKPQKRTFVKENERASFWDLTTLCGLMFSCILAPPWCTSNILRAESVSSKKCSKELP